MLWGLITALLKGLEEFFTVKQQGQLIEAGKAEATVENSQKEVSVVEKAVQARTEAAAANAAVPVADSLPDDGFRRD
jgi:hypothetical protein